MNTSIVKKSGLARVVVIALAVAVALVFSAPLDAHAASRSKNADAKSIKTSVGKLSPKFAKSKTSYKVALKAERASTKITFAKADKKAKVRVKIGTAKWSNYSTKSTIAKTVKPAQGKTVKVKFTVKAQSGKTKTYTVAVSRAEAEDEEEVTEEEVVAVDPTPTPTPSPTPTPTPEAPSQAPAAPTPNPDPPASDPPTDDPTPPPPDDPPATPPEDTGEEPTYELWVGSWIVLDEFYNGPLPIIVGDREYDPNNVNDKGRVLVGEYKAGERIYIEALRPVDHKWSLSVKYCVGKSYGNGTGQLGLSEDYSFVGPEFVRDFAPEETTGTYIIMPNFDFRVTPTFYAGPILSDEELAKKF